MRTSTRTGIGVPNSTHTQHSYPNDPRAGQVLLTCYDGKEKVEGVLPFALCAYQLAGTSGCKSNEALKKIKSHFTLKLPWISSR